MNNDIIILTIEIYIVAGVKNGAGFAIICRSRNISHINQDKSDFVSDSCFLLFFRHKWVCLYLTRYISYGRRPAYGYYYTRETSTKAAHFSRLLKSTNFHSLVCLNLSQLTSLKKKALLFLLRALNFKAKYKMLTRLSL